MAQPEGWISLYEDLANDRVPDQQLVHKCMTSRTGIGETMLHWFAVEGSDRVLEKLIHLGFDVNTQNEFGNTPIMEASLIGKWDNVKVLLKCGANLRITNNNGDDYFQYMKEFGKEVPKWIMNINTKL